MKLKTTTAGENYLHKILWVTVERQMENAEGNPKGAFYDYLAAMVFASHALEAYLNFLGDRLSPKMWAKERGHREIGTFYGKLIKVLELCGMSEPDRACRPYSTVRALKDLRDLIAHAKVEHFGSTIDHEREEEPERHVAKLDSMVTPEKARKAVDDTLAFANALHQAARPKITATDPWFGEQAFDGVLGHSSFHTRRAN